MKKPTVLLFLLASLAARADEAPSEAMLAPVSVLAGCMAKGLPRDCALPFAARGVTIMENFAPHIFAGPDVVARWRRGFIQHLADGGDQDLAFRFGPAQDFAVSGERVYFTLPTIWTGRYQGQLFEEMGAWSFVLIAKGAEYRILGYSWGVMNAHLVASNRPTE